MSIADGRGVAKTRGRPRGKRTERDDRAVKMDKAIVAKAKAIATVNRAAEQLNPHPIIDHAPATRRQAGRRGPPHIHP